MHLLAITLLFAAPLASQNIQGFDSNTKATQWADSLMQHMSMDEKIGQLFMVAAYANRDTTHRAEILTLVEDYHVGGLIFFQGSPIAQTKLLNSYQEQSRIPLWVGMDAEWGIGMRLDSAMSFPFQMTLGAIQDDALIYKM
jgi:beta-glucosidase-like glycosyl hydrolase